MKYRDGKKTRINRVITVLAAVAMAMAMALTGWGCGRRSLVAYMHEGSEAWATAEPTVKDEGEINREKIYEAFCEGFRGDLLLINNYALKYGYDEASETIEAIERYVLKREVLPDLMEQAAEKAREAAEAIYDGQEVEFRTDFELPNWQYLAAVLPLKGDVYGLMETFGLRVEISEGDEEKKIKVAVETEPKEISEFAKSEADRVEGETGDATQGANTYTDIRFTYGYFHAVYDEKGKERSDLRSGEHEFPEGYEEGMEWPLEETKEFVDTWANPRSRNTRYHMGTDIKMAEGSAIKSCTEGEVLYKGTANIPGNYVIIRDEAGYEYHYYHMCKVSEWVKRGDRVEAGQRIGDVGDTGNSDVSHLHISIISPEGEFINPYKLMQRLKSSVAR